MAANWLRTLALGPDAGEYWKHYRKYHAARSRLGRLYHSWRCQRICCIRGASIPVRTKIRGRITFPHGMAGVFLSQDAEIGEGCVIGAGSVVVRDIPPHSFAAGNPCRVIRTLTEKDSMRYKPEILADNKIIE